MPALAVSKPELAPFSFGRAKRCERSTLPRPSAKRHRHVALAPVIVDTVDDALEAVRAEAVVFMPARPEARAGIDHRAEGVDLRWSARMHEAAPARRGRLTHQLTQLRAPDERLLGDDVVDSCDVVGHASISPSPAALAPPCAFAAIAPPLARPSASAGPPVPEGG